jgi:hypothetical protein
VSCSYTDLYFSGQASNAFDPLDVGVPGKMKISSPILSLTARLFCHMGTENLRNAVLNNEPMDSFVDARTKGFKDGKFDSFSLEAVLSLEDNIHKISDQEKNEFAQVSSI